MKHIHSAIAQNRYCNIYPPLARTADSISVFREVSIFPSFEFVFPDFSVLFNVEYAEAQRFVAYARARSWGSLGYMKAKKGPAACACAFAPAHPASG